MHNAAPMTFGARLAVHLQTADALPWFFNVPQEPPGDPTAHPAESALPEGKVQIGPLDV
ncbi:hypothetical protein D3C87_2063580 [compost metagenome]